jgi:hypothetical protein
MALRRAWLLHTGKSSQPTCHTHTHTHTTLSSYSQSSRLWIGSRSNVYMGEVNIHCLLKQSEKQSKSGGMEKFAVLPI